MMLSVVFFTLAVSSVRSELTVRAWKSNSAYPSPSDFPETKLLSSKPNTAIAFSGGGSRAFMGAMGYLAALRALDLLKNVRYIGGISGGAWATIAFTYQQNGTSDEVFLGKIVQPQDIRYEDLKIMDPACARGLTAANATFIAVDSYFSGTVDTVADAWVYGTSKVYLEPLGVEPNTRFSWDTLTVADIKQRNPDLANETFLLPAKLDGAYPIIGTTLVGPKAGAPFVPVTQNYSLLEITPLYIGTMRNLDIDYTYDVDKEVHVVQTGGLIEPFAFARTGGSAPASGLPADATTGLLSVPAPQEFLDLQFSIGASSYATGTFFESIIVPEIAQELSMQCDYFAAASVTPQLDTMMLGDGGSYENIPLISFLQRRVPKIVLFFLSSIPLQPFEDWNVLKDPQAYDHITDDLAAFFGAIDYPLNRYENRTYEYEQNQVFSLQDFNRVALGLQAAQQAGNGIIATFNLTTVENAWWGIPAGLEFEITFSYLGRLKQWEALLTPEMHALVVPAVNASDLSVDIQSGPFHDFPHYATNAGNLNSERANLLADLAGWSVLQHEELFRHMLS